MLLEGQIRGSELDSRSAYRTSSRSDMIRDPTEWQLLGGWFCAKSVTLRGTSCLTYIPCLTKQVYTSLCRWCMRRCRTTSCSCAQTSLLEGEIWLRSGIHFAVSHVVDLMRVRRSDPA